ncbi:MAG: tetratricopeptide repeat protein [Smithella sp.]
MLNNIKISPKNQILIVYIVLTVVTLAVFWQVNQYDFVTFDDPIYVTHNSHISSGFTLNGFRWAFGTTHAEFWHPLTWLSLMLDYQLYGLNAGGYHLTNRILHILSTLLLFWLFSHMTGAIWRSAFVAALFALHPLHVESVAWIAERKDVLSAFFWMLTLCLYVCYTEKPAIKRYLLVLFSFVCALMSKAMVITLPVVMILLDYWPLKRFESNKDKLVLWQLREKTPFVILSAVFSVITLFAQPSVEHFPLSSRLANAPVSFMMYLKKTFWPHDMAVLYPFNAQIPAWQILGSILLILIISITLIVKVRRLPYLFVGWLWYAITLLPVIGIIQVGNHAMADRYHYLPSIGLAVMMAWGTPTLIKSEEMRKKILFPVGIAFLAIMALFAWQQCGYWKNSFELFNHAVLVTTNNYVAHNNRGVVYGELGQYQLAIDDFNTAINLDPNYIKAYYNLGKAYTELGQYNLAIEKYNAAIRLKPDYVDAYNNRGLAYNKLGQYQRAIEDYNKAITLKSDYAEAYDNRATVYLNQGNKEQGCRDAQKACALGNCKILEAAKVKRLCR